MTRAEFNQVKAKIEAKIQIPVHVRTVESVQEAGELRVEVTAQSDGHLIFLSDSDVRGVNYWLKYYKN